MKYELFKVHDGNKRSALDKVLGDNLTLENAFCVINRNHDGSCIHVKKDTVTTELNYLPEL